MLAAQLAPRWQRVLDRRVLVDAEQASVVLYWTCFDGREGGRRGHAYLCCDRARAGLLLYEHSAEAAAKEVMMRRHERWQRAHPATPGQTLRRRTSWRDPSGLWSLTGDLGEVRELLRGRRLEVLLAPGVEPLPPLPEALLRRPITTLIAAKDAALRWPEEWEASVIAPGLPGPLVRREGATVIVCAARYGSRFADVGQDRTAAIWRSDDGGERWDELPWMLGPLQRITSGGRWCWPPEQVLRLSAADPLTIEWDDPWIDWEPGTEWRARWSPVKSRWTMGRRS